MFHAAMQAAVEAARTSAQMEEASRQIWQVHGSGGLTDEQAQTLAERLQDRRRPAREGAQAIGAIVRHASLFPPRRRSVSPDRIASRDRRRLLACSGPMPPAIASRFTEGQRAVLKIVADEVTAQKECGLCIDAIAARAGVSVRLVQSAIRLAEGDGLLTIEERRRQGRKNDPNLIRIIDRDWQAWLRRGAQQQAARPTSAATRDEAGAQPKVIGCKALRPTGMGVLSTDKTEDGRSVARLPVRENRSQGCG